MTMPDDVLAYNRTLIEQFRSDGGASMGDRPLLLLTTTGARTGQQRTSPLMYVREGDRLFVIASANGATKDPTWYHNLMADPKVTVEMLGETYEATATPLSGADYEEQWSRIQQRFPFFTEHQQRAGDRRIPVVEMTRN